MSTATRDGLVFGMPEAEFMARVDTSGSCWEWTGSRTSNGYGNLRVAGGWEYAHRASYLIQVGPIGAGLTIDHLCRNRVCVNPDHLEVVSLAENIRRAAAAKTHCPHGHEYTAENTYRSPRGERRCRECASIQNDRRRAARQARRAAS